MQTQFRREVAKRAKNREGLLVAAEGLLRGIRGQ